MTPEQNAAFARIVGQCVFQWMVQAEWTLGYCVRHNVDLWWVDSRDDVRLIRDAR